MGGIGNFNLRNNPNTSFLFGQTQGGTETSPISGLSLADFKTTMVSLGYTNEQIQTYINNPGQPLLVTPQDSGVTVFDTEKFFENIINGLPSHLGGAASQGEKTYGEAFQEKLNTFVNDPTFLTEIGAKNSDIGDMKIKLALLFPETANEEMRAALAKLKDGFPSDFPGKADLDQFEKEIGTRQDGAFQELLDKALSGGLKDKDGKPIKMDAKDVAALLNAYYNESPEGLTEEQKVMFTEVMSQAGADLETNFGIPKNLKVPRPGKEYFNVKLNLNFEDEFITKLTELKLKGDLGMKDGITEKEFNTLKAMLYFKDAENPEQQKLMGQFETLFKQTLSDFKTDNGLPEGWKPDPQVAAGQASIDGAWREKFTDNLMKMDIPQAMKNEIMQGLANPAGASPIVKSIIETLVAQTTGEIIEAFGLPTTWKPSAKTIDPNVPIATLIMAKAGMANLKEVYKLGLKALQEMAPGDPMRSVLMDYLKKIGDALSKLQESLYILQSSSAKTAKVLALAMRDMQQNKIAEQAKQAEKAREQRNSKGYKKQHDPGKKLLMQILAPIMAIIMLLLCIFTLGVLTVVIFAMAAFMAANALSQAVGGPDLLSKTFEAIGQLVELIGKALGLPPEAISALKLIVKILILVMIVAMAMLGGGGGVIGNMVLMSFLMEAIPKAGLGKDIAQMINRNATAEDIQKAEMAIMIVMMVVMFTIMIVQTVIMTVATAGAGGVGMGAMFASAAGKIAAASARIAAALGTFAAKLAEIGPKMAMFVQIISVIIKSVIALAGVAAKIISAIAKLFNAVAKEISKFVVKMFTKLVKKIGDLAQDCVDVLDNIAKVIAKAAPEALQDTMQSAKDKVTSWAQNIKGVINQTIKIAKAGGYEKYLDDLAADFKKSGKYSQVLNKTDDATSTIEDASKVVSTIEGAGKAGEKPPGTGFAKFADYAHAGGEMAQGVQGMVSGITQAQYAMMMAELVKIQAKSEAYIEEVDAMIKLLKKVIEGLLDSMAPLADFIQDISNLQAKKYTDATAGGGWNAVA